MTRFTLIVEDDDYFSFRRWLRARDPDARLTFNQSDDGWELRVTTAKAYLRAVALRTWSGLAQG